ncbi:hypothetical protein L6452_00855 [Arctium lappa]|uniref:Uncharacterized protein n=1 Tax=Arctium lappa TaxID=4217 RepID=A0ACB9FF10_ARCLA|nr:hypothetical protein L6452_00855 [Arctium lappa]
MRMNICFRNEVVHPFLAKTRATIDVAEKSSRRRISTSSARATSVASIMSTVASSLETWSLVVRVVISSMEALVGFMMFNREEQTGRQKGSEYGRQKRKKNFYSVREVTERSISSQVTLPVILRDVSPLGPGGGVIQGTASEAFLVVLLAARDKVLREVGKDALGRLMVYGSDQTHFSLLKACQVVIKSTKRNKPRRDL